MVERRHSSSYISKLLKASAHGPAITYSPPTKKGSSGLLHEGPNKEELDPDQDRKERMFQQRYDVVYAGEKQLSHTEKRREEKRREGKREMSMTSTAAAYIARRAAQKERVRILYRRALKDTLNWAVHRHLFYDDASNLRDRFEQNKHVEDLDTIDRMIADAEATYNKWRHPDPYIVPWAPGGSKFTRNPTPPKGIEIVYDYGRENND